jgi:hypothetical protein
MSKIFVCLAFIALLSGALAADCTSGCGADEWCLTTAGTCEDCSANTFKADGTGTSEAGVASEPATCAAVTCTAACTADTYCSGVGLVGANGVCTACPVNTFKAAGAANDAATTVSGCAA